RGAWRQRVNAARLTRGSGSLSWPTISVNESKNSVGKSQEHRNSIPLGTSVLDGGRCLLRRTAPAAMKKQENLATLAPSADLTTATSANAQGQRTTGWNTLSEAAFFTQDQAVIKHGQAAPASSSSLGSRQGLWLTPRANEPDSDPNFAARNADRGAHCHGTLSSQAKEMWPTITAHTPDMESNGPNGNSGTYLAGAVKSWATPKTPTGGPETAKRKQELGRTASGGGDLASQANGKLNPRWVETLMGLPIGWTMPSCTSPQTIAPTSCDSSATESCLPPQSELSEFSLAS
ncbi:MAG: hypothetical protein ACO32I_08215, partial [Candidatus Limnocylindrus sp.]